MSKPGKLERFMRRNIPITRAMGVTVRAFNRRGLILAAPLPRNVNDKGTGFAGSLGALLTLSGWGVLHQLLNPDKVRYQIAATHCSIQFNRPVRNHFSAVCEWPDRTAYSTFLLTLNKKGRARIGLRARIGPTRNPAVVFTGVYAAHLK